MIRKQRHNANHDEVGSTDLTRFEPDAKALIEGVEEVAGSPRVEHPDEGNFVWSPAANASTARTAAMRSRRSRGCEASGQIRETMPGTTNAKPRKRKQCKSSSGSSASAFDRPRSSGQM